MHTHFAWVWVVDFSTPMTWLSKPHNHENHHHNAPIIFRSTYSPNDLYGIVVLLLLLDVLKCFTAENGWYAKITGICINWVKRTKGMNLGEWFYERVVFWMMKWVFLALNFVGSVKAYESVLCDCLNFLRSDGKWEN